MTTHIVTLRAADGRERIERVHATTDGRASTAALRAANHSDPGRGWMVASVN